MSDADWTDALIGDVPHFYIYTVSNIGEGIIAKRRSYAALLSHLTAPFMPSGLNPELHRLRDEVHRLENVPDGDLRRHYMESITALAARNGVLSALSIDTGRVLTDDEVERVHRYVEEIENAKVGDGLYTLGRPYTAEQVDNTARLMAIDAVCYGLAAVDAAHGRITEEQAGEAALLEKRLGDYEVEADKLLGKSKLLVKIGPILGLMGTLIPMGPALLGLATGDVASMASNMQVAFATTVVGLIIGAVGFITLQARQRWVAGEMNLLTYVAEKLKGGLA